MERRAKAVRSALFREVLRRGGSRNLRLLQNRGARSLPHISVERVSSLQSYGATHTQIRTVCLKMDFFFVFIGEYLIESI